MPVTWILERDVFSEKCFNEMVSHFKDNGIPYHVVRIIPFIHEIEGKCPSVSNPVVVYGSIGIQKLAQMREWIPGVFTDPTKFNYETYRDALGDLLLNPDCIRMPMSQVASYLNESGRDYFFIKPNGDTKEFAGTLMEASDFATWHRKMLDTGYLDGNDFDIVISDPKKLDCEWRIVVVDGKISSSSLYRQYQMVKPEQHIIPEVADLVMKAHSKFVPAPVYVIDIAQTENGFRVIEYNTFNSAGMYACDVGCVIDDINKFLT